MVTQKSQKKVPKKGGKKGPMPKRIYAIASPTSLGPVSMFDAGKIDFNNVDNFRSDPGIIARARDLLQKAGFEILQLTEWTINIAGSQATFEKAFNAKLVTEERQAIKAEGRKDMATFIDCPDTVMPGFIGTEGTNFEDVLEGVAIEEPCYLMAESMYPPCKSYWHLRVPAGVSLATNADKAHRAGITGRGIKVAMVDSGQYKHPFFTGRGYRVAPVVLGPGAANPDKDEIGHGTGESANIFAVAPDVELLPVKIETTPTGALVNTTGAFNAAVALQPDIITCSWGKHIYTGPLSAADQARAAAVAAAWNAGIVVIFSAGNCGWGFPGQHPDVISAGGVYMERDEKLKASNYSSGFMSNIYQGRRVPDLCGLVGLKPKAAYIMLPLEPGCAIDTSRAGGTHPSGDETAPQDGWAAFSGTSAAAPQLAGAAALILQTCSRLKPKHVRDILMKTARDVKRGANCQGILATPGPDTATGNGLVNAHKAMLLAKLRCLAVVTPPWGRISRGEPIRSIQPRREITPREPEPIRGGRYPEPQPQPPVRSPRYADITDLELASLEQQPYISDEELEVLEDMVIKSDVESED